MGEQLTWALGVEHPATLRVSLRDSGVEVLDLPFEVTVAEAICQRMRLLGYDDLQNMQMVAGNGTEAEHEVRQAVAPKPDEFGLRENGFCPEVYELAFVNGYPVEWLAVVDGELVLRDEEDTVIGDFRGELKLMYPAELTVREEAAASGRRRAQASSQDAAVTAILPGGDFDGSADLSPWTDAVLATQEFDVAVLLSLYFTTLEPDPIVLLEFSGVGSSVLTPWQLTPGARLTYTLPKVSQPELIELALGHDQEAGALDDCQCYELLAEERQVRILLPDDWPRDVTAERLFVFLRYQGDERVYDIPMVITFNDAAPLIQGPTVVAVEPVARMDSFVWQDQADYVELADEINLSDSTELEVDDTECLPVYARTDTEGKVSVVFNHPIEFKYAAGDLMAEVVASGAIQV